MTYCIHDLDPASCADCNGAVKRAAERERSLRAPGGHGPWFEARWGGKCSGCGEEFGAGTVIRSDGDDGWQCGECGECGEA